MTKKLFPLLIIVILLFSTITYAEEQQQKQGFFDQISSFFSNLFKEDAKEETVLQESIEAIAEQENQEQLEGSEKNVYYVKAGESLNLPFEVSLDKEFPSEGFVRAKAKSILINDEGQIVDRQVLRFLMLPGSIEQMGFEYNIAEEGVYHGFVMMGIGKGRCHSHTRPFEMVVVVLPDKFYTEETETIKENEVIAGNDADIQGKPKYASMTPTGDSIVEPITATIQTQEQQGLAEDSQDAVEDITPEKTDNTNGYITTETPEAGQEIKEPEFISTEYSEGPVANEESAGNDGGSPNGEM